MSARSRFVRRRALPVLGATVALAVTCTAIAVSVPRSPNPTDPGPPSDPVYGLAGGCYSLESDTGSGFVSRDGSGFRTGAKAGTAERFRLQAAQLGRFMFFGSDTALIATGDADKAIASAQPTPATDWTLTFTDGAYTATATSTGRQLSVDRPTGALVVTAPGTDPSAGRFRLQPAEGCADFPEADVNATGAPLTSSTGEVRGFIDAHVHMNANEFIGGEIRCGKPYDPQGITVALQDCEDHQPGGVPAVLENVLSHGNPFESHDTTMWPSFTDVPSYDSMTHEQLYYRWVERAWRGGLRMFTNLLVSNRVLCELYPLKSNPCDEMETVRIEARQAREIQDYVDAQYGGPGRGWFRIVSSPEDARHVAASGKLAVTLGVEISEPFGCRMPGGVLGGGLQCTEQDVDRGLDELYAMGVRQMILTHKFDNAFGGVRFDAGITGAAINVGNFLSTGEFWNVEPCTGVAADNPIGYAGEEVIEMTKSLPPGIVLPAYPAEEVCNTRGLTPLGEHAVRAMMQRGMIVDIDHMSVKTADQTLRILEDANYSGVVSSHGWTDPSNYPRIYQLGGFVASYAGSSENFVDEWRAARKDRDDDYFFGYGFGADTNGFGSQPAPRLDGTRSVRYPFTTFDGGTVMDRQRAGDRVFDFNTDGLAQYGLIPDWIEDMRVYAGKDGAQFMDDMTRGPEAYLQMWERVAE
ncbi:peptidase [Rhodococcus sp. ABRD24]|uniref:membrane dipeptidase n=1 Tax=Rhodococcus sp. ABRD24 TaxID=2507582 RepID=UPI00103EEA34|nr:membrane dipeptidase [Rhodococcus sp. ABRD24]QBJ95237.1 peptidase [Rhodococcus sp. ABRD24]